MKSKYTWVMLIGLLVIAGTAAILRTVLEPKEAARGTGLASQSLVLGSAEGFERVLEEREFTFPADHGAHDEYQTEWWYYTGNLSAENGRRFGYQLTFFRRALLPPAERVERSSDWAADQVYFAHFALTDVENGQFHAYERFSRGSAGLAGAMGTPTFSVWLDHWRVEQIDNQNYLLNASQNGISLDLMLTDMKGPVFHGKNGVSQKGAQAGNASYYISLTRLATSGEVRLNDVIYPVKGTTWMDHEFGTSALGEGQIGWDWFSIQLDDGSELMLFTLRREDGSIDPYSSGTLIRADGSIRPLAVEEFEIVVRDIWTSPASGARYPAGWELRIPDEGIELSVEPLMAGQELRLSFTYWEGAVSVTGEAGGKALSGQGYVELTGYAGSMQGQF